MIHRSNWSKRSFLLLGVLLTVIAQAVHDTPRINGPWFSTNDNPYWVSPTNRYQCTWYAWGRAREAGWNVQYTGGADGYWENAQGSGKGLAPSVGAIMCSYSGSGSERIYHVSYVTAVSSNTSWDIAQYNVDPLQYTAGTVTRSSPTSTTLTGAGFSSFNLIGFVYQPNGLMPPGIPSTYGSPQIGYNVDGTMVLGMRGVNGNTHVLSQTAPNGAWGNWQNLGGVVGGNPVFGHGADGLVRFFTYGTDGQIYQQAQTTVNSTSWTGWSCLGGYTAGDAAVASNQDGRVQIFTVSPTNGNVNTIYQLNNSAWSSWNNFGGSVQPKLSMDQNADGRLELFLLGSDGAVYNKWQNAPNQSWYSSWGYLGGNVTGKPVAIRDSLGRMRVFVRGGDGYIYYKYQITSGGDYISGNWRIVAGGSSSTSNPSIGIFNNQLYVFVRGTDGSIYYSREVALDSWTTWEDMNARVSNTDLAVGYNQDGRLQIFCTGNDGTIYSKWMIIGGGWSIWTQMGP